MPAAEHDDSENGSKSTRNHLYTCVNTNAVFAATFPCILFRFWRQNKSTAVYCGSYRSIQLCPAHFYCSTPKMAAKAPKPMFDVFKDIYCLCTNFAMDFFRFCCPQRHTAVYRPEGDYPVHLSRPLFAAVRPETAAKAPETIYIRALTLMLSLPLLIRVFYSVLGVKRRVL